MATWDQIRHEVQSFRASIHVATTTVRDLTFDSAQDRIYFLANDLSKSSKSPMLFRVDLPEASSISSSSSFSRDVLDSSDLNEGISNGLDVHSKDSSMVLVPFDSESHETLAQAQAQAHEHGDGYRHGALVFPGPRHRSDPLHSLGHCSGPEDSPSGTAVDGSPEQFTSTTEGTLTAAPVLAWIPVLSEEWIRRSNASHLHYHCDRLTTYQLAPQTSRLMFSYGSVIYTGDILQDGKVDPRPAHAVSPRRGQFFGTPPAPSSTSTSSPTSPQPGSVHFGAAVGTSSMSTSGQLASSHSNSSSPSSSSSSSFTPVMSSPATHSNRSKDTGASMARSDPKLGGANTDLIAFIRDYDIWVMTTEGVETQLTFCSRTKKRSSSAATISCGVAEFVMQEEFYRNTGYYWAPTLPTKKQVPHCNLPPSPVPLSPSPFAEAAPTVPPTIQQHEQQQESTTHHNLPLRSAPYSPSIIPSHPSMPSPVSTFSASPAPSSPPTSVNYTAAAISSPTPSSSPSLQSSAMGMNKDMARPIERILYLQVSEDMVDLVIIPQQGMPSKYEEYRYPHTGTANAISDLQIVEFVPKQYELLLDRRQQMTAIVVIPQECFMSATEYADSSKQIEDELLDQIRVIFRDESNNWINVTDILYFFTQEEMEERGEVLDAENSTQFIVSSERSGFRHLYLTTYSFQDDTFTLWPITSGPYQVVDKPISVDAKRQLVYFIAKRDTVLETHLYVASFARGADPENARRLTELGYSHQVTLDIDKDRFTTLYSSVDFSPACAVFNLHWTACRLSESRQDSGSWAGPDVDMDTSADIDADVETCGDSYGPLDQTQQHLPKLSVWCRCGCQLPNISTCAYIIREGIYNRAAEALRKSPIVPPSTFSPVPGNTNQSCSLSNSCMTTTTRSISSVSDSRIALNEPRPTAGTGSVNSISGFLTTHLLPGSLLQGPKNDTSLIVSSSGSQSISSLKFLPSPDSIASLPGLRGPPSNNLPSPPSPSSNKNFIINALSHPVAEFFSFTSSDKVVLNGCLYRPNNYIPGRKYPTLVSIYGGPRSQMVTNEHKLSRFVRVFLAIKIGLAVVMVDGRGSCDRGE
ncbi:dipeptidylpeptidase, partial [Lunasporangiospora selenospora]